MQHRKRKRATAPKCRVDLDLALYSIPGLPRSCVQGQTFCRPIHEQEDEKSNTNSRVSPALRDYLVWPRSRRFSLCSTPWAWSPLWPHCPLQSGVYWTIWVLFAKFSHLCGPKWGHWERADFPTRDADNKEKSCWRMQILGDVLVSLLQISLL